MHHFLIHRYALMSKFSNLYRKYYGGVLVCGRCFIDTCQVERPENVVLVLTIIEVSSVIVFAFDYVARVRNASASCEGDGVRRYVFSFFGLVDLLSFLPFFLGLLACGGLGTLSPKLLPTLVRRHVGVLVFVGAGSSLHCPVARDVNASQ